MKRETNRGPRSWKVWASLPFLVLIYLCTDAGRMAYRWAVQDIRDYLDEIDRDRGPDEGER